MMIVTSQLFGFKGRFFGGLPVLNVNACGKSFIFYFHTIKSCPKMFNSISYFQHVNNILVLGQILSSHDWYSSVAAVLQLTK